MLSGVLSDTLVLRSPTTTERDRAAADWLASLARVDVQHFGEALLRASPGLASRSAAEIIDADRKAYDMSGRRVSIGQVEVAGFQELPGRREELLATLAERQEREELALLCLMITDVVAGRSRLLAAGELGILRSLPYVRLGEGEWDLGEAVSRKKQLVPALSAVLDDGR
jgi:manganese-dependent inorganic pyrophosphatase